MKNNRFAPRRLLLLCADAAMIVLESKVLFDCWQSTGPKMLRMYTQDSNLFALAVSFICACFGLYSFFSGKKRPSFLKILRLAAASGLMVTFLVSSFVLTPINSGASLRRYLIELENMMLDGPIMYLHTLCPIILCFSFLFLEDVQPLRRIHSVWILPPTILYGAVTLYNNYTRAYVGPYPFFHVYRQPLHMTVLWCALIVLGAWLVSLGILELHRLIHRKRRLSSGG